MRLFFLIPLMVFVVSMGFAIFSLHRQIASLEKTIREINKAQFDDANSMYLLIGYLMTEQVKFFDDLQKLRRNEKHRKASKRKRSQ